MIRGILIILAFLELGSLLNEWIGTAVPGSVIGMLLLFVALQVRLVKLEHVKPTADILTQNMALFFVPAGVGLMNYFGFIADHWMVIILASVISTVMVLATVGLIHQKLEKKD
ncbi:CidA/LrgA family protein [Limibacter armeniacum]|uniref:CidA/LrgA family protein n=1 Tax=Limibacter armeniacum TaxID=466084 RepID=UPI002FE636C4